MLTIITNLNKLKVDKVERGYKYSNNSIAKIEATNKPVQDVCYLALEIANKRKLHCPDFGISHGLRTAEEQFELYKVGRAYDRISKDYIVTGKVVTNCDGRSKKSNHQSGNAIDFYAYVDGEANYEPANMALIATCFFEAASNLGIDCDWGGSFRSISDSCHFEVK